MFDRIVTEASVDLFRAFGVTIQPSHADVSDCDPMTRTAAVVTFAGPEARGTLVLATSFDVVASCAQEDSDSKLTASTPGAWVIARDCTKELVNQLLGRIKNRLRSDGINFESRTPTVVTGHAVASVLNSRSTTPYRFAAAGAKPVAVWFDVVVSSESKRPAASPPANAMWEGDVHLCPPQGPSSSTSLQAQPTPAGASTQPPSSRREPSTKKVLIIDDSLIVRQQVGTTLRQAGYTVLEAASGLEGLRKIESGESLGLVICDVNMPVLDGLALLENVANRGYLSRCPFVMLTSEAHPEAVARARALGLRGWMVKPVKSEALVGVVKKLVG